MSTRTSTLRRVSKKTAVVATAAQNREQQIVDHLPLVKYLAQRIATRLPASVEVNDLISAGIVGLIDAVEKFNSAFGLKFFDCVDQTDDAGAGSAERSSMISGHWIGRLVR